MLLNELNASFLQMGQRVFSGHADQLKTTSPFYAFQDIFESTVDEESGELKPEFQKAFLDSEKHLIPLLKPALPNLKTTEDTPELNALTGQQKSGARLDLLIKLLLVLAKPGSLILLENAHWCIFLHNPLI